MTNHTSYKNVNPPVSILVSETLANTNRGYILGIKVSKLAWTASFPLAKLSGEFGNERDCTRTFCLIYDAVLLKVIFRLSPSESAREKNKFMEFTEYHKHRRSGLYMHQIWFMKISAYLFFFLFLHLSFPFLPLTTPFIFLLFLLYLILLLFPLLCLLLLFLLALNERGIWK